MPNIVRALRLAIPKGLRLPLVYNTGGYDALDVIEMLDGIVDIYLPDFKYLDGEMRDSTFDLHPPESTSRSSLVS